jgi:hypothetical protein
MLLATADEVDRISQADVRFVPQADIPAAVNDVRFWG